MKAARQLATYSLPAWVPAHVAACARTSLLAELHTWPKPGLVSHVDQGSHSDMEAATFETSAAAIEPFFARLTEAGAADAAMPDLRSIGVAAEQAMMAATGGINTPRLAAHPSSRPPMTQKLGRQDCLGLRGQDLNL